MGRADDDDDDDGDGDDGDDDELWMTRAYRLRTRMERNLVLSTTASACEISVKDRGLSWRGVTKQSHEHTHVARSAGRSVNIPPSTSIWPSRLTTQASVPYVYNFFQLAMNAAC